MNGLRWLSRARSITTPILIRFHVMGGSSRHLGTKFHTSHTANSTLDFLMNWLLNVNVLYFISLLDGAPREAVARLALTKENYDQAITTLQKRFGGTQHIISKHMEALLQIESVSSSQKVKALRRQFDNSNTHVRSLESIRTCLAQASLANYSPTSSPP